MSDRALNIARALENAGIDREICENFAVLFVNTVDEPPDQVAAGGTRPMLGSGPKLISVFENLGQSRAKAEKLAQIIVDLIAEARFEWIKKRLDKIEERLDNIEKCGKFANVAS